MATSSVAKLVQLLQIAVRSPEEFLDRMEAIITARLDAKVGGRPEYHARTFEDALVALTEAFRGDLDWSAADEIEREVNARIAVLEQ